MANQTILKLQTKRIVVFSLGELERYGVKNRILESLSGKQRDIV